MPIRYGMQHPTWLEMLKNRRLEIPEPVDEPKYDRIDSTGFRYDDVRIPTESYFDFDDRLRDLPRRTWRGYWSPIEDAIENERKEFIKLENR